MEEDFARYVIGTNSGSTNWLSLKLEEPPWAAPDSPRKQLAALVEELDEKERAAWETFQMADNASRMSLLPPLGSLQWLYGEDAERIAASEASSTEAMANPEPLFSEREGLQVKRDQARAELAVVLTADHAKKLQAILEAIEISPIIQGPPQLDLREIQRYVIQRVYELGWTTKRFGYFDRFVIRDRGRDARKAERIGKKYQWIAYDEIMALVADHFQYLEQVPDEAEDDFYDGPWQDGFRDIDPSCSIRALQGGTSWGGHVSSWWAPMAYGSWGDPDDPNGWGIDCSDLPAIVNMLAVARLHDTSRWLNTQGYLCWQQPLPADKESTDIGRRDLWVLFTGYLIRTQDADDFMRWAEDVDFWGRWMPEPPELYRMFLGEHGWAPASRFFEHPYHGDPGWVKPEHGCPVKIRPTAVQYLREAVGFDCSVDETYTVSLPAVDLMRGMGLRWAGDGADFLNGAGETVVFDPTITSPGPSALLFSETHLRKYLDREKLSMCWAVLGGKRVISPGFGSGPHYRTVRLTGAYRLDENGPAGFLKCLLDDPEPAVGGGGARCVRIIRSSC